MNTENDIIKTAVQFIDPESGARTPAFFVHDVVQFATELKTELQEDEKYGNLYCLIIGYYSGANELIEFSTAPLLRVSSLIDRVLTAQTQQEDSAHGE